MSKELYVERYVPDPNKQFDRLSGDHTSRYIFARQFVGGAIVLEDGCGCGYGSKYLAENGASYVVATDISAIAIKFAKKFYSNSNLDFVVSDGTHLPFRDDIFDTIISFEVVEHVANYKKYLQEIHRTLKQNGILIISTPNKMYNEEKNVFYLYHIKEFYPDEFYRILKGYFSECLLYGKSIIDPEILSEQSKLTNRIKNLTMKLIFVIFPTSLVRKMPRIVLNLGRLILSKGARVSFKLGDFRISENEIEKASDLIAICRVKLNKRTEHGSA